MNKKILASSLVTTTLIVTGVFLTKPTYAFWPFDSISNQTQPSSTPTPTFLDKLVTKFGLNKAEVQTAINEYRTERQQAAQTRFEANLTTAVQNGELTEAQKQLIINKHNELVKIRETQFQQRQTQRTELETWATQNGIDIKYFGQGRKSDNGMGQGMGKGMGRGMGQGMGQGMMEFDNQ